MVEPEVSVIVATFNEEGSIENCLRRVVAALTMPAEVLVVDGGHDRTGEIVQRLATELSPIRYIRNENDRGKGHATQVGIAAARGNIMVEIDADLQFLPEELPRLIGPIQAGTTDVVLGSRFMKTSTRLPGSTPPLRTFGNFVVSLYASILFGQRMTDVLAGMSAWTRATIEKTGLRSDNSSYEVELPVKALKHRLRVLDVPVTTDARKEGKSNVKLFRDGMAILRDITLFRLGLK